MQTVWIPSASAEIEPGWLNEVLADDVRDGGVITSVTAQVIAGGAGRPGEVARLWLQYEGAGPRAVTSMIAKLPRSGHGRQEHRVHLDLADRMVVDVPAVYANLGDVHQDRYLLLLEDMAPRRPGDPLKSCSWGDAVVVMGELARHHAAWWEHPELPSFADWMPGPGDPSWETARQRYEAGLPTMSTDFRHLLGDRVVALAERFAERWDHGLRASAMCGPLTFVHGDVRLDNMLFLDHDLGTDLVLLDWQSPMRASPLCDVVQFLAGNFQPAWRRRHQAELVRIYFDALVGNGVTDFSFEQCWDRYRANGLVLLASIVNLAGDIHLETFDERGRELSELMCRRYAEAIEDLGSANVLA